MEIKRQKQSSEVEFHEASKRLKEISQKIKERETDLEESIALLEESIELFKICNEKIDQPFFSERESEGV